MSKRELPQIVTDLQAVRDRLTPLGAWIQGSYGPAVGPNCIMGAIYIVTGHVENGELRLANPSFRAMHLERAMRHTIEELDDGRIVYGGSVVSFNDITSHKAVLDMIDRTIEHEKQEAGYVQT